MNELKKTTFWGRVRQAIRAFKGKPATSISLGLEIKRCDECARGYCEQCIYKDRFERWMNLRNCHDCLHARDNSCGVCPKLGEEIRINCPTWKPKKEDRQP